jgi:hypothetical protein
MILCQYEYKASFPLACAVSFMFVYGNFESSTVFNVWANAQIKLRFSISWAFVYGSHCSILTCLTDPSFSLCLKQQAKRMYIKLPMYLFFI